MTKQEQIDYLLSIIRDCVDTLVNYGYWEEGGTREDNQEHADWFYEKVKKDIGYEKN